jgi:phosphoinositide-3-kinase regulatory subunit 4
VAAKSAALANSPAGFWDLKPPGVSAKASFVKSSSSARTDEAHVLKDKGISRVEEKKIVAMKEFIVKQAYAARA